MDKNNYLKFYNKKIKNSLKYYLIHCLEHKEREDHINNLHIKLGKLGKLGNPININIFCGIYTKYIDVSNQIEYINSFDKNICFDKLNNFRFKLPGQIGCYLSHFKLIEKIMNDDKNHLLNNRNYSVIFEDDVKFDSNLNNNIIKIINDLNSLKVDFDLIFLGNTCNNHGIKLINNIYYMDNNNNCFGTHALLINNKNIKKIYNINCNIKNEIDSHYTESIKQSQLNGFVIYPSICFQNTTFTSNIRY